MQLFQFQEVQIYSPLGVEEQVFLAELEHDSRFELKHEVSPDEPYFALNNLPYSDRVYKKKMVILDPCRSVSFR